MKALTIKNNWFFSSDLRLDASYHLSEGPLTKLKLANSPFPLTNLLAESERIFSGNIFKRTFVFGPEHGWPYLTGSDMIKSDINSGKYVSKKITENVDKLRIHKGWILITCSGTLGNTVYTNEDFEGRIGTHDLIRVIPNEKNVKRGCLYAYLKSKYGYSLLIQSSYGGVVKHIEPHHIKGLPIPIFPDTLQAIVHKLIEESANLRNEANKQLEEVIQNMESSYDFFETHKAFSININQLKIGDKYTKELRLEADYYQPSTKNIINQIKQSNWHYLADLSLDINRSGLRERKFVNSGIPLITGQNLNLLRLDNLKKLSKKFTRNIQKNTTTESDILISVQGTIGKTEYVYRNIYQNVFASEQLTKIKIDKNKIHPGFVYAFLKSRMGNQQLLKHKTGSVIEWIKENNIGSVIVPIPEDKGWAIGEKVNSLTLLYQEAYLKESEAINLVEQEIESWQ